MTNIYGKLKFNGVATAALYLDSLSILDEMNFGIMDRDGNVLSIGLSCGNLHAKTDGTQWYIRKIGVENWEVIPMGELHNYIDMTWG